VLRNVFEVTSFQIEQIQNVSGFTENFRDPQPLNNREVEDGSHEAHFWGYPYDATEWGRVSAICKDGTSQSPIDLPTHQGSAQNELKITIGLRYNLTASHGHSLKWALNNPRAYPSLYFDGSMYFLLQLHCHTGSEHTVDGLQYPGECHFVHQSASGEYAVVGIFLDDSSGRPNSVLAELLDDLHPTDDWDTQKLDINFDYNSFLEKLDLAYFWSYDGSFTTPDCDENVQWIVLRDVLEVASIQIEQIQNISGFFENFRAPQPLNDRTVKYGSEHTHHWGYPYDASEWGKVSKICEEGTSQSPVDLPTHGYLAQDKLDVAFGSVTNLTVTHEHSLKWALSSPKTYPSLNFNGLLYSLLQVHCHTGSEHTIEGLQFPAECHFVYQSSSDDYAVIGIFLNDSSANHNSIFSELIDGLPETSDWTEV